MSEQAKDKTILVVDDEEDVRCFLVDILEDAGFRVRSACDGVEAMERVKEEIPDLISLDLVMPNKSGIRFLHELRRNSRWVNIPVIIVTAHAHDELGSEDFTTILGNRSLAGPGVYLEKPVEPDAYAKRVSESLGIELEEQPVDEDHKKLQGDLERLMQGANAEDLAEAIQILKNKRREP